jgi:hypothetical protein
MIAAAVVTFDKSTPHPGLISVLPTAGAALIIVYGGVPGTINRILTWKPVVGVGLISYSVYLWHQPLFAFARAYTISEPSHVQMLGLIAVAIMLATVTWRFVEQPVRTRKSVTRKHLVPIAVTTSLCIISIGVGIKIADGMPGRFHDEAAPIFRVQDRTTQRFYGPDGKPCGTRKVEDACSLGVDGKPATWALVGDSHAGSLATPLHRALQAQGLRAIQLTHAGCPYVPGTERVGRRRVCSQWSAAVQARLADPAIKNVILAGRYVLQSEMSRFDNGEGGREYGELAGLAPIGAKNMDEASRRATVIAIYQETVVDLLKSGKRVFLVYPIPEVGWDVPNQLFKLRILHGLTGGVSTSHERYLDRSKSVLSALDQLGDHPGLIRIRPASWLCNSVLAGRCVTELNGKILYRDDDHLSQDGAQMIIDEVFRHQEHEASLRRYQSRPVS